MSFTSKAGSLFSLVYFRDATVKALHSKKVLPRSLGKSFYGCKTIERTTCFATLSVMRSWCPNALSDVGDSGVEVMLLGSLPPTLSQVHIQICICLSRRDFYHYQGIFVLNNVNLGVILSILEGERLV